MNRSTTAVYSVILPVSQASAFEYHAQPGALRRLVPPWQSIEIESTDDSLADGSRVVMRIRVAGVPVRWVAQHTGFDPPHRFEDIQLRGPFAEWHHRHLFRAESDVSTELTDSVTYQIPAGVLGRRIGGGWIRHQLDRMFTYRHAVTAADLRLAASHPLPRMRIAVSGSHGLIGSQLCPLLSVLGHRVVRIVRGPSQRNDESIAVWAEDPPLEKLRQVDAVIHLAGKPIADKRWSDEVKQEIRASRIQKTRQLCERLAKLGDEKPRTLLCASAIGIYGDRGDEMLSEASADGRGFLAEVARDWEEACRPAVEAGIRVVHLRFGLILSPRDSALAKMLMPGRLGLGGRFGGGDQWWSWIAIDDCVGAIYHALATETLRGPVNVVAPEPIRNREFAQTLGRVLSRPAVLGVPTAGLRLAFGEMADSLLLASAQVLPERLQQSGYVFRNVSLESALRHLLGRGERPL